MMNRTPKIKKNIIEVKRIANPHTGIVNSLIKMYKIEIKSTKINIKLGRALRAMLLLKRTSHRDI